MAELETELRLLAADLVNPKGKAMDRWDQIRHQVETHEGSDLPRMNFEGLMDDLADKFIEAANALRQARIDLGNAMAAGD